MTTGTTPSANGRLVQRTRSSLSGLRRSLPALALALSAMITGCAAIPAAKPVMSSDFAARRTQVRRLAILPVDLSIQTKGKKPRRQELDAELLRRGVAALVEGLRRRGYRVDALVGPDGAASTPEGRPLGVVIHATDLAALRVRLHSVTRGYHTRALRIEERTSGPRASGIRLIEAGVDPKLARSLARLTGTDASLYTRAWAYVVPGESGWSVAGKVLLALLAVALVVGAIFLFVGATKGSKSRGKGRSYRRRRSSHRHYHASRHRRSRGAAVRALADLALAVGHVAVHTAAPPRHLPPPPCSSCPPPPPPPPPPPHDIDPTPDQRSDRELPSKEPPSNELPVPAPSQPPGQRPPPSPSQPSQVLLPMAEKPPRQSTVGMAMSLLDHRSGKVLWHVEQRVPIKLDGAGDVRRLVHHFLKTLPMAPAGR